MQDHEYLLIDEAAQLLRAPVATLRKWRHEGGGPPARKVGRRLLYKRDELIAWADAQTTDAA